jgi:4a-hydroxytetrahydrobiopterin dehydratase
MATSEAGYPVRLNDQQIDAALKTAPEWALVGESIQRTFQFTDFVQAMKFVDEVAQAAEAAQHHPDILIRYSRVTLTLATHDSGGITVKDFDLAKQTDVFASKHVVVTKPKASVAKSGGVGVSKGKK